MSIRPTQKLQVPRTLRKKSSNAIFYALRDMKYRNGIGVLEKYRKSYRFDDKLLYALGVLYDHEGMRLSGQFYSKSEKSAVIPASKRKRVQFYFEKAETIFRDILSRDPKNVSALFRLGILAELNGKYRQAVRFKLRAYRIGIKDKKKRIPLLIGFTYLKMGGKRKAEIWLRKELSMLGKNDPSANLNFLLFYFLTEEYNKALPYALKAEKILKHLSQRKTMGKKIQALWLDRIRKVKTEARIKMANS